MIATSFDILIRAKISGFSCFPSFHWFHQLCSVPVFAFVDHTQFDLNGVTSRDLGGNIMQLLHGFEILNGNVRKRCFLVFRPSRSGISEMEGESHKRAGW
jgi:hypothetical protein